MSINGLKIVDNHFMTASGEEMFELGKALSLQLCSPNTILALRGDLGAGKTTFLKGFISSLTQVPPSQIQSPTFTYLQIYAAAHTVYHFDLYRIAHDEQFKQAGFMDYLHADGIACLEWADRIESCLPASTFFLDISYLGPSKRECRLRGKKCS